MSESWKNRLWSLLLVCTFAVVLSVCNKAMDNSKKSSSGIAYADFKPSDVSHLMVCANTYSTTQNNSGNFYYYDCDASNDDSSIASSVVLKDSSNNNTPSFYNAISLDTLSSNGWRFCGTSNAQFRFCK